MGINECYFQKIFFLPYIYKHALWANIQFLISDMCITIELFLPVMGRTPAQTSQISSYHRQKNLIMVRNIRIFKNISPVKDQGDKEL